MDMRKNTCSEKDSKVSQSQIHPGFLFSKQIPPTRENHHVKFLVKKCRLGQQGAEKTPSGNTRGGGLGVEAFWIWEDDLPGWQTRFFLGLQQVVDPAYRLPPGLPPGSKAGKNSVPRCHMFASGKIFTFRTKLADLGVVHPSTIFMLHRKIHKIEIRKSFTNPHFWCSNM